MPQYKHWLPHIDFLFYYFKSYFIVELCALHWFTQTHPCLALSLSSHWQQTCLSTASPPCARSTSKHQNRRGRKDCCWLFHLQKIQLASQLVNIDCLCKWVTLMFIPRLGCWVVALAIHWEIFSLTQTQGSSWGGVSRNSVPTVCD